MKQDGYKPVPETHCYEYGKHNSTIVTIQHTSTGVASTIMALLPIFIIPPSIWLFKHKVTTREIIGTIISLAGVALFFL